MNAPTTRRLLLAVALSGAVLTGCVPGGTTGTASGGCDPNGFGPLANALDLARRHAPNVECNGITAVEWLARHTTGEVRDA